MLVSSSTIHTSVLHTIDTYIVLYILTHHIYIIHTQEVEDRFMEFDHHRIIFIPSTVV